MTAPVETKRTLETGPNGSRPLVTVTRCEQYDSARVRAAVRRLLEPLGWMGAFVRAGDVVLLKPNMLSAKEPDRAVTTHPVVLEAVVREVQEAGGEVWIGDSPPQPNRVRHYWKATGFQEVAERTGARLVSFETSGVEERRLGDWTYHLALPVLEADVIINLPKLKTHNLTLLTAAVKNMFGCVPGGEKGNFHRWAPHPDDFAERLVDVFELTKPRLTLLDGIVGMHGNGPASGDPAPMGILAASASAPAVDVLAARALGLAEDEVATITAAAKRGLGPAKLSELELQIVDDAGLSLPLGKFKLPGNRLLKRVPRPLLRFVGEHTWLRPVANHDRCTQCGICASACPVGAIEMDGYPKFDYDTCITCWCCSESCPFDAIEVQKSLLAKLLA